MVVSASEAAKENDDKAKRLNSLTTVDSAAKLIDATRDTTPVSHKRRTNNNVDKLT